eukprot:gene6266-6743_t
MEAMIDDLLDKIDLYDVLTNTELMTFKLETYRQHETAPENTFFREDLQLIHTSPTSVLRDLDLKGRDFITQFQIAYMQAAPDKVTRLSDIRIRQRVHAGRWQCEVWATMCVEQTAIFKTNPRMLADVMLKEMEIRDERLLEGEDGRRAIQPFKKRKSPQIEETSESLSPFRMEDHFESWKDPVPFKVTGSMVFVLDEEKRVQKLVCFPMSMTMITKQGFIPVSGDPISNKPGTGPETKRCLWRTDPQQEGRDDF